MTSHYLTISGNKSSSLTSTKCGHKCPLVLVSKTYTLTAVNKTAFEKNQNSFCLPNAPFTLPTYLIDAFEHPEASFNYDSHAWVEGQVQGKSEFKEQA